jgi:uncharacterized protein YdeI (BOF family)
MCTTQRAGHRSGAVTFRMRQKICIALLALSTAGCGPSGKMLGKFSKEPNSTVLAINAGDAPPRITLKGEMVEKCPQAGCWFRLSDGTGVIKVDTKGARFVVTEVPLNTTVTVVGKLVHDENEPRLEASGLLY